MPEIALSKIKPNKLNPRFEITIAGLNELADSIRSVGLIEPIIVRPKNKYYEIVVGERRYRAAQQAGLNKVPTIIKDYSDEEVMEINLIENIHREDLNAVEKGNVCKELLVKFPDRYPTKKELAKHIGLSQKIVSDWLFAAEMPTRIQSLIAPESPQRRIPKGKIDYRTATIITRRIEKSERAADLLEEIASRGVPRRVALQITKKVKLEPERPVSEIFKEVIDNASATLPFSKTHANAIISGIKTQTSRKSKDPLIQPGARVRASITQFADLKIKAVYRKKLEDFSEEDANREGGYSLQEFKEIWKDLHGEWNPQETVYVIEFELEGSK